MQTSNRGNSNERGFFKNAYLRPSWRSFSVEAFVFLGKIVKSKCKDVSLGEIF